MHNDIEKINELIRLKSAFIDDFLNEIKKHIVGQEYIITRIILCLLSDGHILLEGAPGLAKTKIIKTIANCIATKFQRIQFTPDLLPADLIGTLIYNQKEGIFTVNKGPIFANIILADEINRAPAKAQSALLEAMQERQVTIGKETYKLDEPFLTLATQNPIEQEGTYPLPEAQVDRFMMKLLITYPSKREEIEILNKVVIAEQPEVKKVVDVSVINDAKKVIHSIYMDEKIKEYIVNIINATRKPEDYGLKDLTQFIEYGASPRASINLCICSKAMAFINHRGYVTPEDIKSIALDILRHRIILTYEAEAEQISTDFIVKKIIDNIEVP